MTIQEVRHQGELYATIIRRDTATGVKFLTDPVDSLQVGLIAQPEGYIVRPHVHVFAPTRVTEFREVLYLARGSAALTMYTEDSHQLIFADYLEAGDVVIHRKGGHGLVYMSEVEIFEVKQGKYLGPEKAKVYW